MTNQKIELEPTFVQKYDQMILSQAMREMYDGTDFYNVGYWNRPHIKLGEACHAMVMQHLEKVDLNSAPSHILDVACGLGATTACIAQSYSNANLVGINVSPNQIEYAKSRYGGIEFKVMDATNLLFPKERFDLIFSIEAAFHFNTRKDFLDQAYDMLKPGGQLIFSDILLNNSNWLGDWSVPEANIISDINIYKELLLSTPFTIEVLEDITTESWSSFCQYLRQEFGRHDLANGLEQSVEAYLLLGLRKECI